jgi:hypothetical protein
MFEMKGDHMFSFVGRLVVTSFALYGLVKFVKNHVVMGKHEGN